VIVNGKRRGEVKIGDLRKRIDTLDERVTKLLNQRAKCALKIRRLKVKRKGGVYAPDREKDVYKKVVSANKGPLSNGSLITVYREIMSADLALERSLAVAYLGPPATFTHLAALKKFGSSVNYLPVNSITDVFSKVERGEADYGVVPIENSVEGAVSHTLDMFMESDLQVCSEVSLEICHNLLSDYKKEMVKKVYSNPLVFGQCRIWLKTNLPRAELIEVSSTTRAAEIAAKEKGAAAIASSLAAKIYKLKVAAKSIEDSPHNITRFLVISSDEVRPTGKDKTSIMFSVKDKVGALYSMLYPFKKNAINLTKIESRPSKKKAWDYYFFVDMKGHYKDNKVARALKELEKQSTYLKILGSYPAEC